MISEATISPSWVADDATRQRILGPDSDPSLCDNLNGPRVIRVPDWFENALAKYYLYFGHHRGKFIRLAYADHPEGPWQVHEPGTLTLEQVPQLWDHIASPDVHVDHERREIRMYVHGGGGEMWWQESALAISRDGLHFEAHPGIVAPYYLRAFRHDGEWLGIARDGNDSPVLLRSPDGLQRYRWLRPVCKKGRHVSATLRDGALWLFYTRLGDAPECILVTRADMKGDPMKWTFSEPEEILRPIHDWEGAGYPLEPSRGGPAIKVNQLRDPEVFVEGDNVYLYYCAAGESCLGTVKLRPPWQAG